MKFIDIILEDDENEPKSISDNKVITDIKEIEKLKKLRIALRTGIIKYWDKDENIFTYELSSNFIPYNQRDGRGNGLAYKLSDKPFGVKIYMLRNNEFVPLFDKLSQAEIEAIFFGGPWKDTTRYGSLYEVLFKQILNRFRKFGSYIWAIR